MKIQEIREIIKLMDQSTLDEFVFESEGTKLKLKKNNGSGQTAPATSSKPAPAAVEAVQPVKTQVTETNETAVQETKDVTSVSSDSSLHTIKSPMVGTFYEASSPEADAYVKVGDKVSKDSVVCIVEAMKLFNEIESEIEGEIVEILVKDGQLVEYGQPLFSVK